MWYALFVRNYEGGEGGSPMVKKNSLQAFLEGEKALEIEPLSSRRRHRKSRKKSFEPDFSDKRKI